MMITTEIQQNDLAYAVEESLSGKPKQIPSWLLYDKTGNRMFQSITRIPEYYLTACEHEIIKTHKEQLRNHFTADGSYFELVEFGAGDGSKTETLLKHFAKKETAFSYQPIEASETSLNQLVRRLDRAIPELTVNPVNKYYVDAFSDYHHSYASRKVFLYLGSNIGSFTFNEAINFIKRICWLMWPGDQLMIGFDLKKNPRIIQSAYDDKAGITRAFNLNVLSRLNREVGARFDLDQFEHYPFYDSETGVVKSYLVSLCEQDVYIEASEKYFHFDAWETIQIGTSQKYDPDMIQVLADKAGLNIVDTFHDKKNYFCDVLFSK